MYTILSQIAADALGVEPSAVHVRLGDSSLPAAPVAGGSMSTASAGPAALDALQQARRELVRIALGDGASPLHGLREDEVELRDGAVRASGDPARAVAFAEFVRLGGIRWHRKRSAARSPARSTSATRSIRSARSSSRSASMKSSAACG